MARVMGEDLKAPTGERQKRLRQRNWALLLALLGFVVLVYVITIVKMKGG